MEVEKKTIDGERIVRVSFGNWSANDFGIALVAVVLPCFFTRQFTEILKSPLTAGAVIVFGAVSSVELTLIGSLILAIFGHTTIVFKRSGSTRFTGIGSLGITKELSLPSCGVVAKDSVVRRSGKRNVVEHRVIVRVPYDRDRPRVIYSSESEEQIDCLLRIARDALAFIYDKADEAQRVAVAAPKASAESRDRAILARPPKGIAVARDTRKRTVVTYRRRTWQPVVAFVALLGGLAAALYVGVPHTHIVPVLLVFAFWIAVTSVMAAFSLFGKRTLSMEYGEGETFVGIGNLGFRKKFRYGPESVVEIAESGIWLGNTPMDALLVSAHGAKPTKLCTTWPNKVKPFLAAVLRDEKLHLPHCGPVALASAFC